ncbi:hypothetical protein Mal64_04840 [Pseudobythopirellula maris]|uniref:Uncharacterized protein n=2 Tax=Pseudobythopirellula maris TaxID=2527991 RepID=A0A5C5ZTE5_9BACT|nr:hypothetical protein Mal64_04840 [Pseudobythopirellula maris]
MLDPKHPLAELLRRDDRYHFDAYVFVFDALRYAQEKLGLGAPVESSDEDEAADDENPFEQAGDEEGMEPERHVTGQDLCRAIQGYAIDRYGLMAQSVLGHWGVRTTGDFGEIVFNLIDIGQMRKTDSDRREDFDDVYDFAEALGQKQVFAVGAAGADHDEERHS